MRFLLLLFITHGVLTDVIYWRQFEPKNILSPYPYPYNYIVCLKYGLRHSFIDKNKFVKKDLAVEFEV